MLQFLIETAISQRTYLLIFHPVKRNSFNFFKLEHCFILLILWLLVKVFTPLFFYVSLLLFLELMLNSNLSTYAESKYINTWYAKWFLLGNQVGFLWFPLHIRYMCSCRTEFSNVMNIWRVLMSFMTMDWHNNLLWFLVPFRWRTAES